LLNLQEYLSNLLTIKMSGMAVKETSYYGSIETFINKIGSTLKPTVRTIINTKNVGSGIPDGGLFTKEQFSLLKDGFAEGTLPSRGVIEIKGTSENLKNTLESDQVKKYLTRYGQVLVTNYYQFQLVILDSNGNYKLHEKYNLAENEKQFWNELNKLKEFALKHEEGLTQFLKRVLLHKAPLNEPKDVAWYLASYAKDARRRIEQFDIPALNDVKVALEESIGISFNEKKGDHFFKSTLIQTLFYGVFSSWVLFCKEKENENSEFNWRLAGWYLKVPMIRSLFERVANQSQLGRLGLIEVLDYSAEVLNRINRTTFFEKFEEEDAVLYFYEPFLEEFDKELRKEMGVWYTPKEIVKYIVEKVDKSLKEELGIKLGLADKNVYVLDPACGTGAFIVEVIKKIQTTLASAGGDALTANDIKEAATKRIFGFEILPAPFVVAHLQIGVLLQKYGVPIESESERVGVYLTNSLTGWDPPKEKGKQLIAYPEMQEERDAAEKVKREQPILVILGNPPYNAFAGVSPKEEGGLIDEYKKGLTSEWGIKKYNLDDLYIRFFRLAERRISEKGGKGIVSFISNFSFLRDPSYVVMRKHLVSSFDKVYIDCLNGDSRETGKTTPDGKPDPSVFSTDFNKAGIRTGTTITTLIKHDIANLKGTDGKYFRQFWGTNKSNELLDSVENDNYEVIKPTKSNWFQFYPFKPEKNNYKNWPLISELCTKYFVGLEECRGGDLIETDRNKLIAKFKQYFDTSNTFEQLMPQLPSLTKRYSGFEPRAAREKLLKNGDFSLSNIKQLQVRPLEYQWCFYSTDKPLWNRSRPELVDQIDDDNFFIITRFKSQSKNEGYPASFTKFLFDKQTISRNPIAIPYKIKKSEELKKEKKKKITKQEGLFEDNTTVAFLPNLGEYTLKYLNDIGFGNTPTIEVSKLFWQHCMTILFTNTYIRENKVNLLINFPRVPLPNSKDLLEKSASLGAKLMQILDTDTKLEHNNFDLIKEIGVISSSTNSSVLENNLFVDGSWGTKTKGGVMPGHGTVVERPFNQTERNCFVLLGLSEELIEEYFGKTTFDIYMNTEVFWKNIPSKIWNFHIGGYQVLKKWLSYRERLIIDRNLSKEEVREFGNIAKRLGQLILLQSDLNNNYQNIKANTYTKS
jgi:type I restriction-modification system DNA methylase subunit